MGQRGRVRMVYFYLQRLVLVEVLVVLGVMSLCTLVRRTGADDVAQALFLVGALILGIAPFSMAGGWTARGSWGRLW